MWVFSTVIHKVAILVDIKFLKGNFSEYMQQLFGILDCLTIMNDEQQASSPSYMVLPQSILKFMHPTNLKSIQLNVIRLPIIASRLSMDRLKYSTPSIIIL